MPGPDFEGIDATLEIFDVSIRDQRAMRSRLREQRAAIERELGQPVRFLFHSPEQTSQNYSWVRSDLETVSPLGDSDLEAASATTFLLMIDEFKEITSQEVEGTLERLDCQ